MTHRNLINNAYFVGKRLKLTLNDKICIPVPLYHCFGCVMGTLCSFVFGITAVLPSSGFDPLQTLRVMFFSINFLFF